MEERREGGKEGWREGGKEGVREGGREGWSWRECENTVKE